MQMPFRCKPIYKEKVWGGRWFEERFGRILPDNRLIGESWEVCYREGSTSEVVGFAGVIESLEKLVRRFGTGILGKRLVEKGSDSFPLLIKFLDASDRLSVQVHPDDAYMVRKGICESGKAEMWYILDAEPGARIVIGVKEGVTREEFQQGIEEGFLHQYLTEVEVKPGDAFYIPAGTVHAILSGVRIAEIQQNSDTTYRIYDWNRVGLDGRPRDLHIQEALEVIDFSINERHPSEGITITGEGWQRRLITACEYFVVEELLVIEMDGVVNPERFEVWMVIEGFGELLVDDNSYKLGLGETWFIPANLGSYQLNGKIKFLRTYVPDLEIEIVKSLLDMGFCNDDLQKISGLKVR